MIEFAYQRIAVGRLDGGVSIMSIVVRAPLSAFAPDAALANGFIIGIEPDTGEEFWDGDITDLGIESEIARARIPAVGWRRISVTDIPSDRTFRNAWGPDLTVNMEKAREIVRARIRAARTAQLQALDGQAAPYIAKAAVGALTAQERAALATIEAQRQALRDAPADPAIAAAATPEELKALLP